MTARITTVLVLLSAVVVAPFLLRPEGERTPVLESGAERLVIISPHNESIRSEFGRAFRDHMERIHDRRIRVDWRQPGGTSEIARVLRSEYTLRFEQLWKKRTGLPFDRTVRDAFTDPGIDPVDGHTLRDWLDEDGFLESSEDGIRSRAARTIFLRSNLGVGIDLFFGGGAYDFSSQAGAGNLVATDASGEFGPAAVAEEHPDWFSDAVMPAEAGGEPFRDPGFRWVGAVLSGFGITTNRDTLERLGFENGLTRWEDLADPRLFGQVALADPGRSGSAAKAFEMLIQQQIHEAREDLRVGEEPDPEKAEALGAEALWTGWERALRLLLKISANARYFTDSSTRVPHDVAQGDAAAGMSIDFYGRTYNERHRDAAGESRVQFVLPRGGTSIGADPIGMLRGAPHPELAHRFIEFVLSLEGQQLWNYRPGTEGGPRRFALRRPPIRKDFYTEKRKQHMTDPDVDPYEVAAAFTYRGEWTGSLFHSIRFLVRCACVEPHEELSAAWGALIENGFPEKELAEFEDLSLVSYDRVREEIAPLLRTKDKIAEVALARELSVAFREKYRRVAGK